MITEYRVGRAWQLGHFRGVQRLFSMFPRGWPGTALLLLRVSVVCAVLFQIYVHRQQLPLGMQGFAIVLAVALSVGYQTPVAAVIGILFHGFVWAHLGIGTVAEVFIVPLDALALALLGPGAYSVDSYRFGRRVLVLPP